MKTKIVFLELTRRILDEYESISMFAKEIKMCENELNQKLNGLKSFSLEEVLSIIKILNIPITHIFNYFFQNE